MIEKNKVEKHCKQMKNPKTNKKYQKQMKNIQIWWNWKNLVT